MKMINSTHAPAALGSYSQAVEVNGTLYLSGQIPLCPEKKVFVSDEVGEQTAQCLKNIQAVLEEAGYTLKNIVKCTLFIKDMNDFSKINEIYGAYFSDHQPARVCVEVARLPKDALVEIDAIAVK